MPRSLAAALAVLIATAAPGARGDDVDLASRDELAAELTARNADIARTLARVDALEARAVEETAAIDRARMESLEADRALSERAAFLYRLGRRGAAFRYLFGAPTASDFLRRYATLKRLVADLLVARREAGERLAEAEADLARTSAELQSARSMLSQLEEARIELLAEVQRLGGPLALR